MDLPLYFPTDCNRRLAGLQDPYRKKFSVVFQDFGRCGHVDVRFSDTSQSNSLTVFTAQRQHNKHLDRSRLCAQTPTLPLSDTPVKVHYPFRDRVIGEIPQVRAKIAHFARSLSQVSASFKQNKAMWSKQFLKAKQTLDAVSNPSKLSSFQLDVMEQNLPDSVRQLICMYTDLSQQPSVQAYNSRYSGGLLSCVSDVSGDGASHFLFHATGRKLKRLILTQVCPSDSCIVASQMLAERRVESVYQVDAACVHDRIFVGTRHKNSCSMFSVPAASHLTHTQSKIWKGNSEGETDLTFTNYRRNAPSAPIDFIPLGMCHFDGGELPTSVSVSPYLPGEGMFCTDNTTVYIWNADRGVQRRIERLPRFDCYDSWLHAYFGTHPRHIALADRTAVQMLDHRDGFRNSVDLFALPSQLVHRKECIMAARHHGNNSPLHTVATSHCLFVVDQRFGGTPVMQWHPDLKGPLQYLTSADYLTNSESGSGVVLAGSQYPAEVMCYPFSHGSGCAVTTPLNPWRLSRISDVSDTERYDCFLGGTDPAVLHERLGLSLAGVAVARGLMAESLVTYQVDCYGEVYFQQYSTPQNPRTACKTGVPASGAKDQHVPAVVQDHVRSWLQRLQEQVDNLQTKREQRRGLGIESYLCRLIRDEGSYDPSAPRTTKRCCFCDDDTEPLNCDSGGTRSHDLLCRSCHWLQHNFHSSSTQSAQSSQPLQSPPGSVEDCTDGGRFGEDPSSLDGVAPPVGSYETDANSSVLFRLMGGESELQDVIEKREEQRSKLLEARKEKIRSAQERKKQRRQTTDDDLDLPVSFEESRKPPEHTVFNTAMHQRQNSLIRDVLSKVQKAEGPVTVSHEVGDEEVSSELESENTPPVGESVDHSSDLFDQSEEELDVEESHLLSQDDDDDEFFTSQDTELNLFKGISGSPVPSHPPSQRTREGLNVSTGLGMSVLTPRQSSPSPSLIQKESPASAQKLKPFASPKTTLHPSSGGARMVATPQNLSPVLKQRKPQTAPTKTSVASSQETRSVSVPHPKISAVTPSPLTMGSPSGVMDSDIALSSCRDSLSFPHSTSPVLVPQTLKSRSSNVLDSLTSPQADISSPHLPKLTPSSEKHKSKSVKKVRRSLLSGFC